MRKSAPLGVAVILALSAVTHPAVGKSVCYQTDDEGGVLVLDVRFHSFLTRPHHARGLDAPVQTTYSAHGKTNLYEEEVPEITAQNTEEEFTAQGATITVAKDVGALLALYDVADCFSNEASPTPEEWQCFFFVEETGKTLTKADSSSNELCNLFFVPDLDSIISSTSGASSTSSGQESFWRQPSSQEPFWRQRRRDQE